MQTPTPPSGKRDRQAAGLIDRRLARSPDRQLLVIRGEPHVLPGRYLDILLAESPLVILTVQPPTFSHIGDRRSTGRMFTLGESGRVFFLACGEPLDGCRFQPKTMNPTSCGRSNNRTCNERDYPARQFATKLRRLADCIEQGKRFRIQVAGERASIPPGAAINIEHERGDGQEEIEFQLVWSLAPPVGQPAARPSGRRRRAIG